MNEAELTKWILETKIELETLRTMLIQRGKLNSMEFESLASLITPKISSFSQELASYNSLVFPTSHTDSLPPNGTSRFGLDQEQSLIRKEYASHRLNFCKYEGSPLILYNTGRHPAKLRSPTLM